MEAEDLVGRDEMGEIHRDALEMAPDGFQVPPGNGARQGLGDAGLVDVGEGAVDQGAQHLPGGLWRDAGLTHELKGQIQKGYQIIGSRHGRGMEEGLLFGFDEKTLGAQVRRNPFGHAHSRSIALHVHDDAWKGASAEGFGGEALQGVQRSDGGTTAPGPLEDGGGQSAAAVKHDGIFGESPRL